MNAIESSISYQQDMEVASILFYNILCNSAAKNILSVTLLESKKFHDNAEYAKRKRTFSTGEIHRNLI